MNMISIKVENLVINYKALNGISIQTDFFHRREKRYTYTAINDLSFEVEKGDILGLIGRNGSGKSTLLKAIGGMMSPDAGSIDLRGQSVALLAIGVGFKPQMTGRENIYIAGLLLGFSQKIIKKKEQEIIDFAELGEFIDMPVRTYSSGMYSRLGFAITATLETDIVLIDEVLSVGDERFQKKSYEKMQQLISNKDKTVIICSHSRKTLADLCNKALWIDNGEMVRFGDAEKILEEYQNYMQE
ncbi:ABC transporter ATP-binding protein [Lachnospiraceae bacterium]|jgi:ABC-type polysaccharide/polyol phosphate transport system, ATPase component|nr:ABC transporter ATP-binding protein [Lachnospiraceae bacterium]